MELTYDLAIFLAFFAFMGLISLFSWQKGFAFFLVYIFFEDALRMKIFNNNVVIQIAKDFLLLGIYAGCFIENRKGWKFYSFVPAVLLAISYKLANILNPKSVSVALGFASLRLDYFYFPIIWVSSIYFESPKRLAKFLITSSSIVSLICVLAFVQILTGPQWWWNFFGNYDTLTAFSYHIWSTETGTVFRPFGIFNNSGRFMSMLQIFSFFILLGWSFQDVLFTKTKKKIFWVLMILFIPGFIYSISRTAFLLLLIITVFYILQLRGIGTKEFLKKITLNRIAFLLLIFIILTLTSSFFAKNVKDTLNFLSKSITPGEREFEVGKRASSAYEALVYSIAESGFIGHGTGANSLGLLYILGKRYKSMNVESGYAAVIWESGIIGLFVWIYLWYGIFKFFQRLKISSKNFYVANANYLATLNIFMFLACYFTGFQVFQSWIFNLLLWNFLGIVIAINTNSEKYLQYQKLIRESDTK